MFIQFCCFHHSQQPHQQQQKQQEKKKIEVAVHQSKVLSLEQDFSPNALAINILQYQWFRIGNWEELQLQIKQ